MQNKLDSAVVVLFNPDNSVLDNIATYINNVDSLYIVDNSTTKHSLNQKLLEFKNIKIIHSGENIGISKALNLALRQASSDNYKYLMTMDQDTSFNNDDVDIFFENFNKINKNNLAIVSALHNSKFIEKNHLVEKECVMTSANIVDIAIALCVGGYDENLFIDEVDHEFCFRLLRNNFKILENRSIAVNHALGEKHSKNSKVKIYPSIRLYYMIRNYLYLKKNYDKEHTLFFKKRDSYLLKFFFEQIIYGKNRFQNIKMIIKGYLDFKNSIYGKYNG